MGSAAEHGMREEKGLMDIKAFSGMNQIGGSYCKNITRENRWIVLPPVVTTL
jgi:hypothetical protein